MGGIRAAYPCSLSRTYAPIYSYFLPFRHEKAPLIRPQNDPNPYVNVKDNSMVRVVYHAMRVTLG